MNQILRSAALIALLAGSASAQISTPPPPAPPPTPEYVPPPIPAPPRARPGASNINKPPELPDLPFESLAVIDKESGKLQALKGAATRLALDRNPMIDEATRTRVNGWLAHRDARLDQIVIDNLDIVEKIDGGAMEQVKGEDMKLVLKSLRELAEPLKPPGGDPSIEASKQGILTRDQAAFSQKIIFDYNKAKTKERRDANPPVDSAAAKGNPELQAQQNKQLIEFTIDRTKDGIAETLWRYPALLAEASKNLDKTDVPADAKAKLVGAVKAIPAGADDTARAKAMKDAMQSLTLDQKRELLRKTIALRPSLPPLPEQPVKAAEPEAEGGK